MEKLEQTMAEIRSITRELIQIVTKTLTRERKTYAVKTQERSMCVYMYVGERRLKSS